MRKVVPFVVVLLSGCFLSSDVEPPNVDAGDTVNFEVITRYYCDHSGWPEDLNLVREWAEQKEIPHELDLYRDAKTDSSRRILYTVNYLPTEDAEDRRTITFIAPPRCPVDSEPQDPSLVSMAGGGVTFRLSPDFAPLDADQMRERWGDGPYPDVAWESGEGKLLVSARFGEVDTTADELKSLQEPLEAAYAQSAKNIVWKVRKFGKVNGAPWIRLAYESDSIKGRLYNTSLTTTFKGKLLTLSFTSPLAREKDLSQLSKDLLKTVSISTP